MPVGFLILILVVTDLNKPILYGLLLFSIQHSTLVLKHFHIQVGNLCVSRGFPHGSDS